MRPITKDLSQMMLNKAGKAAVSNLRRKEIRDGKRGHENRGRAKSANEKLIDKANRKPVKLGAPKKYTPEYVEDLIEVYKGLLKEKMPAGRALAEVANMAKCHELTVRKMLRGTYFDKVKSVNEKYGLTPYVGKRGRPPNGTGVGSFDKDAVLDWYYEYQHQRVTIGVIAQQFKVSHHIGKQIAYGSYYRARWGEIPPESERDGVSED
jgi:hypothetical protein